MLLDNEMKNKNKNLHTFRIVFALNCIFCTTLAFGSDSWVSVPDSKIYAGEDLSTFFEVAIESDVDAISRNTTYDPSRRFFKWYPVKNLDKIKINVNEQVNQANRFKKIVVNLMTIKNKVSHRKYTVFVNPILSQHKMELSAQDFPVGEQMLLSIEVEDQFGRTTDHELEVYTYTPLSDINEKWPNSFSTWQQNYGQASFGLRPRSCTVHIHLTDNPLPSNVYARHYIKATLERALSPESSYRGDQTNNQYPNIIPMYRHQGDIVSHKSSNACWNNHSATEYYDIFMQMDFPAGLEKPMPQNKIKVRSAIELKMNGRWYKLRRNYNSHDGYLNNTNNVNIDTLNNYPDNADTTHSSFWNAIRPEFRP